MAVEQRAFLPSLAQKVNGLIRKPNEVLVHFVTKALLYRVEPKIIDPIQPEYLEGFDKAYSEVVTDPNALIILIPDHQVHADGLPLSKVTQRLTQLTNAVRGSDHQSPGFVIIISKSMKSGHQGAFIREITTQMEPKLQKRNLFTNDYTRDTDEKYGIKKNNTGFMVRLARYIKKGYGMVVFPEATMEGGRRVKGAPSRDDIHGMQEFNKADFKIIIALAHDLGKNVWYVPVGLYGGFNIESPDTNLPTLPAVVTVFTPKFINLVETQVKVELPVSHDDVIKEVRKDGMEVNSATIGFVLGRRVSHLVPRGRGVFAHV